MHAVVQDTHQPKCVSTIMHSLHEQRHCHVRPDESSKTLQQASFFAGKFFWYLLFTVLTLTFFTFWGMVSVALTPNTQVSAVLSSGFYTLWWAPAHLNPLPAPLIPVCSPAYCLTGLSPKPCKLGVIQRSTGLAQCAKPW